MRYHRLSAEELVGLEKEMAVFLASHSITAPEWEAMKISDSDRAEALLDEFSDLVIHRALTNIKALKIVLAHELYLFSFESDAARVVQLNIDKKASVKLNEEGVFERLAEGSLTISRLQPQFYKGTKSVVNRELEMYQLMLQGAQPVAQSVFDAFAALVKL